MTLPTIALPRDRVPAHGDPARPPPPAPPGPRGGPLAGRPLHLRHPPPLPRHHRSLQVRHVTILTRVSVLTCHNIISTCGRRKSTRLVAVAGGLVTALGCLFTSFASQWHQVFIRQTFSRATVSQNFTSPARDNLIMISQPIVMNRFSKLLMILLSYPYLLNGQYYLVVK